MLWPVVFVIHCTIETRQNELNLLYCLVGGGLMCDYQTATSTRRAALMTISIFSGWLMRVVSERMRKRMYKEFQKQWLYVCFLETAMVSAI